MHLVYKKRHVFISKVIEWYVLIHGQQVSGFLYLGNDLSFTAVYKEGFAGSKQELQQQIYHRGHVALINPSRAYETLQAMC